MWTAEPGFPLRLRRNNSNGIDVSCTRYTHNVSHGPRTPIRYEDKLYLSPLLSQRVLMCRPILSTDNMRSQRTKS